MLEGYRIRLDSNTRVRVFETQIVDARLELLRKNPTYNSLLRHFNFLLRNALNIKRYILYREDNSGIEEISKLLRIDNTLVYFTSNALNIVNERRLKP